MDWNEYSDKSKGYIYCITNEIDGRLYIGQTKDPYKRWNRHLGYARHQNYKSKGDLYLDMGRLGADNFSFKVIDTCEHAEMDEREKFWIRKLNSLAPNGYNLLRGGVTLRGKDNPFWRHKHTQETKKKISIKNTGRVWTDEQRELAKKRNSGENAPFYGRHHTPESIAKLVRSNTERGHYKRASEAMKGNDRWKYVKRKRVAMISMKTGEVIREFTNAVEAGNFLKDQGLTKAKHPNNIVTGVCSGNERSAAGYYWEYIEEDVSTKETDKSQK